MTVKDRTSLKTCNRVVLVLAIVVFTSAFVSASNWSMFKHDKALSSFTSDSAPSNISQARDTTYLDSNALVSPAVSGGYAYTGSCCTNAVLIQLNASNVSQVVEENSNIGLDATPAVANGYLYVPVRDPSDFQVSQVNASNVSQEVAKFNASGADFASTHTLVHNGYVYFGDNNDVLYQLNASNVSNLVSSIDFGSGVRGLSGPVAGNGYIYTTHDGTAYQLDENNISNVINSGNLGSGATSSKPSAVNDNYLYVPGSTSDTVYQLDADNVSKTVSSFSTPDTVDSSPAIGNGYVYVGDDGNNFYQLDASDISNLVNSFSASGAIEGASAVNNEFVFVSPNSDDLYQLDAGNISKVITSSTLGGDGSSPAIAGGAVYDTGSSADDLHQHGNYSVSGNLNLYLAPLSGLASSLDANGSVDGVLSNDTEYERQDIKFINSSSNRSFASFEGRFDLGDVDLRELTIEADSESVAVNTSGADNIGNNHTLYLPNNNGGAGVIVCPDAEVLSDVGYSCNNLTEFTGPFPEVIDGINVSIDNSAGEYVINNVNGSGAELSDNTPPEVDFVDPTPKSGDILDSKSLEINVTAVDNDSGLSNITVSVFNGTGLVNSSNSSSSPFFIDFSLFEGDFVFNATAFDEADNRNVTSSRSVTLDTVAPDLSLSLSSSRVFVGGSLDISCSASDSGSGVSSTILEVISPSDKVYSDINCEDSFSSGNVLGDWTVRFSGEDVAGNSDVVESVFEVVSGSGGGNDEEGYRSRESHVWFDVEEGEELRYKTSEKMEEKTGVSSLSFSCRKAVETIKISLVETEKKDLPEDLIERLERKITDDEKIYRYLEFQHDGLEECSPPEVDLVLLILKSWLKNEGLELGDVGVYRFSGDVWNGFDADSIGERRKGFDFESVLPSLSYLAIAVKKPVSVDDPEIKEDEKGRDVEDKKGEDLGLGSSLNIHSIGFRKTPDGNFNIEADIRDLDGEENIAECTLSAEIERNKPKEFNMEINRNFGNETEVKCQYTELNVKEGNRLLKIKTKDNAGNTDSATLLLDTNTDMIRKCNEIQPDVVLKKLKELEALSERENISKQEKEEIDSLIKMAGELIKCIQEDEEPEITITPIQENTKNQLALWFLLIIALILLIVAALIYRYRNHRNTDTKTTEQPDRNTRKASDI